MSDEIKIDPERLRRARWEHDKDRAKVSLDGLIRSSSRGTVETFARRWDENDMENGRGLTLQSSIAAFRSSLGLLPFVIVGAGPSLDYEDQAEGLLECRERVTLVCADAALRQLVSIGANPDFVMTADVSDRVPEFFRGFEIPAITKVVMPTIARPDVAAMFPGRAFFFTMLQDEERVHRAIRRRHQRRCPSLVASGNVGNMMARFALFCGARKVCMVGMDCCFTGGRTHCRLFEADGRERTVNDLAPETLGHGRDARGMSVMSNVQFLAYAELMEAMAREEKGASFVNVGGYGLLGSADGTAIKITSWREATGKERGDAS